MVSKIRLKTVRGSRDIELAREMNEENDLVEKITTTTVHRTFNSLYSNRAHGTVTYDQLGDNRNKRVGDSVSIYTKDKIIIACRGGGLNSGVSGRVYEFKRNPTNVDHLGNYIDVKATAKIYIKTLQSQDYIRLYDTSGSVENFVWTFDQDTMSGSSLAYNDMPASTFTQVAVPGNYTGNAVGRRQAAAQALVDTINASTKVKMSAAVTVLAMSKAGENGISHQATEVTITQDDPGPDGNTNILRQVSSGDASLQISNTYATFNGGGFASGSSGFEWVMRAEITPSQAGNIGFGYSVQANKSGYLAVGAPQDQPLSSSHGEARSKGAVYIFKSSSSGWQQEARLTEGFWGEEFGPHIATSSFSGAGATKYGRKFGEVFALHPTEPLIAIGQYYVNNEPSDGNIPDDLCNVSIWRRDDQATGGQQEGKWRKEKHLTAMDTFGKPGSTCFKSPNDQNTVKIRAFGHSLEFSGSYLAVGGGHASNAYIGMPELNATPFHYRGQESVLTEGAISIFKHQPSTGWINITNFTSSYAQEGNGNHFTPRDNNYPSFNRDYQGLGGQHGTCVPVPYSYGRSLSFLPGNRIIVTDHFRAHKFHSPGYINSAGYDVPDTGYSTGSVEILSFEDNGNVTLLQTLYSKKRDNTYETNPGGHWRNQHYWEWYPKYYGEEAVANESGDIICVLEGYCGNLSTITNWKGGNEHASHPGYEGPAIRNLYIYKLNSETGNYEFAKRIYDQFNVIADFDSSQRLTNGGIGGGGQYGARAHSLTEHRRRRIDLKEELVLFGSPDFGDNQLHWGDNSGNRQQADHDPDIWQTSSIGKFSVNESDVSITETHDTRTTTIGLSPLNVNTAARLRGQAPGNTYTLTIGKTK